MLWFVQRIFVLLLTSLPGSFVLAAPTSRAFGFGLGSLVLEVLTRRVSAPPARRRPAWLPSGMAAHCGRSCQRATAAVHSLPLLRSLPCC